MNRVRVHQVGIAALFAFVTALSLAACSKPAVGGKCTAKAGVCTDDKNGLYCSADGTYKAMTCNGDTGCKADGTKVACDNDVAAVDDGCDTPDDGACAADHKSLLQCKNEKFTLVDTCKGPGSCKVKGGTINCDNDIADNGDPCSNDLNFACTVDKGMALQCQSGKYVPAQSCRGPKSCAIVHGKGKTTNIDCDYSVAAENDPCATAGDQSCSADHKTMLTCTSGKYTSPTACPGNNGCTVKVSQKGAKVTCDGQGGGNDPDPEPKPKGKKHKKHSKSE